MDVDVTQNQPRLSHTLHASFARQALWQQKLVDANLTSAAAWRGILRSQWAGRGSPRATCRYRHTYDTYTRLASRSDWSPNTRVLLAIHHSLTGMDGFRLRGVRLGPFRDFPHARAIPEQVVYVIDDFNLATEPRVPAALRLHLRLLTLHPFLDGNGRSSRLIASLALVNAGHRSTLVTALEEIFATPRYVPTVQAYWRGRIDEDHCLQTLLRLFLARSEGIAALRSRADHLRTLCREVGIASDDQDRSLRSVDFGSPTLTPKESALLQRMEASEMPPWHRVVAAWSPTDRRVLLAQIRRLTSEEQHDPSSES